jgi:hypothetical protein
MRTRPLAARFLFVGFLIFAVTGCDEGLPATGVGRGVMAPSPAITASIVPSPLSFITLPAFSCPIFSPFQSTLSLLIDQRGGVDVTLHEVQFHFVDGSGVGSTVPFGQSDLNRMFGTPFIAAGANRLFTFHPAFGCGFVSAPQTLRAHLVIVDRAGGHHAQLLNAILR